MDVRVSIFQRRRGRQFIWWTLGLGQLDRIEYGPTQTKVQQRLVEGLRKEFGKRKPSELERLEFVRGRRLEVVKVPLVLPPRRQFERNFPLIIEPRSRGAAVDGMMEVVYHPMRPGEWFVHEPGRDLAAEAAAFFRTRWGALTDEDLAALKSEPKDRLRLVSFSASPKKLLDLLEKKKDKSPLAFMGGASTAKDDQLLGQLGTNQTLKAIDGILETGMSRSPFREQLQQLVCGKQKAPVLLVGPSGVGKSVLLQQLVVDLLAADDFPSHRNLDKVHAVWHVRGHRIIAGMSYLGQWEQRCVDLLEACRKRKAILWVDDLQAWGRIGESRESDRSLATFFRGPVARGELIIVGETTASGYQQLQDDAPGFAAAFTTLFVEPTDRTETMRMLVHEARKLELEHNIAFDPLAFRTIYQLGGALGAGSAYPGKAIDLLRALATGDHGQPMDLTKAEAEAKRGRKINAIKEYRALTGAGLKASKEAVEAWMDTGIWPPVEDVVRRPPVPAKSMLDLGFPPSQPTTGDIGPRQVVQLLARRTGIPEILLAADRVLDPAHLRDIFAAQIMGQDAAVDTVRDLIVRIKAGLVDPGRPYGVFLFTGPTGTGKTEMAKCIAEYLYGDGARLLRFDMSEYSGWDAPARLIGDRYRPEGALTSKVRAQPFSVVLLDEIEKAAPAVLNLMLQLFDDGRLTDATGTVVDFTHAVVVMTSNLGSKTSPSVGFEEREEDAARDVEAAVREFFPPELFNRIDRVVQFGPLSPAAAHRIARRELSKLLDRRGLTERNVFVRFTPAVVDLAVREGFNKKDGARSLKRWLEERVGGFLADAIAGAKAAAVRVLWLHLRDGELTLHSEQLEEAQAHPEPSALEELLSWTGPRLREEIPTAVARARELSESDALAELGRTLSDGVKRVGSGDADAADNVYMLDAIRDELRGIADDLTLQAEYDPVLAPAGEQWAEHEGELVEAREFNRERVVHPKAGETYVRTLDSRSLSPALPFQNRHDVLQALASLHFLQRAITLAPAPEQHAVLVEITRMSRSAGATRFEESSPGLAEWLAYGYAAKGRGTIGLAVFVDETGRRLRTSPLTAQRVAWRQIVFPIVGPAVRAFFAGEHGTHVRESLTGGTEIVRVRMLPLPEHGAWAHIDGLDREREAFMAALEAGAELPTEHPDSVLPIVRRYDYDPPPTDEPSWIDVEDYPLMYAARTQVRGLIDVLPTLWLLRMGAHVPEGGG